MSLLKSSFLYLPMLLIIPLATIDLLPSRVPLNISYPIIPGIGLPWLSSGKAILLNSTPNTLIEFPGGSKW